MADGYIPDRKMNHQLMRLIEKDKRRPQFDHRNPNRWTPRGAAGEAGPAAQCLSEPVFNFVEPMNFISGTLQLQLTNEAGTKPGPIRWYMPGTADNYAPGGSQIQDMYERNRNNGYVQWTPGEIPLLDYLSSGTWQHFPNSATITTVNCTYDASYVNFYAGQWQNELRIVMRVTFNAVSHTFHAVYKLHPGDTIAAPTYRSLTQGYTLQYDTMTNTAVRQTFGFNRSSQDGIISNERMCIQPSGVNTSGDTATLDETQADLVVTFSQAFTGTANPNEYDNVLTITAYNNSSENMTVQYDRDLLYLNHGQTTQLDTNSTFAVTAGGSNTKAVNTTVTAVPGSGVVSQVTGSITATGDTTSKAYTAYGSDEAIIA